MWYVSQYTSTAHSSNRETKIHQIGTQNKISKQVRDALILRLIPTALSYLTLRSQVRRMRETSSLPSNSEFLKHKLQSPSIVMESSNEVELQNQQVENIDDTWFERTFSFVAPSHVNMDDIPKFVYDRFREIAEYHIYNLLCDGISGADTRSFSNNRICFRESCNTVIFESAALLRTIGCHVSTYLREVAYRTSMRALRESVVFHLRHT